MSEKKTDMDATEQTSAPRQELLTKDEFAALEHRRIDVAQSHINAGNEANVRLHTYHMERLKYEQETRRETRTAILRSLGYGSICLAGLLAFILYMLFFGEDEQARYASLILQHLATGIGGFGIGYFLLITAKKTGRQVIKDDGCPQPHT